MITDMKKLLVVLDEETAKVLEGKINKSAYVRESVKYMSMDISTDTLEGMRKSYQALTKLSKEMDAKLDYISNKLQ